MTPATTNANKNNKAVNASFISRRGSLGFIGETKEVFNITWYCPYSWQGSHSSDHISNLRKSEGSVCAKIPLQSESYFMHDRREEHGDQDSRECTSMAGGQSQR